MPKPFPRFVDLDLECTSSRIFCTFLCWGYSTLRHRNSLSCSARDSPSHQLKKRKLSFFWQGRSFPCINRLVIFAIVHLECMQLGVSMVSWLHSGQRGPQEKKFVSFSSLDISWGRLNSWWCRQRNGRNDLQNLIRKVATFQGNPEMSALIIPLSRIAHKSRSRSQCDSLSLRFNVQHEHPQTRRFSDAYRRRYAEFNLGN